jgi:hypothetical protein
MKCDTCGETIKSNCDWRQGRCPHRSPLIDEMILDAYRSRFLNLFNKIKNLFKK